MVLIIGYNIGMKDFIPTEDEEEIAFKEWCDSQGLLNFHVPQETYTKSWRQLAHNTALGVLKGVSDHWVKLPTPLHPNGSLIVIELKRRKGNTPTNEQINFMSEMEEIDNVTAVCCYGADEAIKVCEELRVGDYTTFDMCWERTKKIEKNRKNLPKTTKNIKKPENDLPY